jgi:hypothetical protein
MPTNELSGKVMTMNNSVKIEREELGFIYQLILEGRGDVDILQEYRYLSNIGELKFPLRTDDNFIKDRRLEIEAALGVLQESISKIMRPLMLKQKEEHFAQVVEISATLLQNFSEVKRSDIDKARYKVSDSHGIPNSMNKWQLLDLFRKNIDTAYMRYTIDVFNHYYLPHLKAVMPEMAAQGFWPLVEKDPFDVIIKIKELVKGKELVGVCPLCNQLENPLPLLVR